MARIGVLGGTFDPPHNGHLAIAQNALTQLELAQVVFAPTHLPPHKLEQPITPIEARVEMVRLAIVRYPQFVLSRVDVDRAGPTYTVDTLKILRAGWDKSAEIFFIMGMDSLANLLTWHKPDELIAQCKLAVFARPGFDANLDQLETRLPGLRARVEFLQMTPIDTAARDLQMRVRAGLPIAQFVAALVAEYIAAHNLFRGGNTGE
jgi:nicotinate-nucleotide adenylyltransferase